MELPGTSFGDLLKRPCGGLLITERFAQDFKAEGFTGLGGFHPVEVTRVRRERRGAQTAPPPRYVFVTPAYGLPALDLNRGSIRSPTPVLWGVILVSERFMRFASKHDLDPMTLVPSEEYVWNPLG